MTKKQPARPSKNRRRAERAKKLQSEATPERPQGLPFSRQRGQRGLIRSFCQCGGTFEQWWALLRTGRSSRRKALRVKRCNKCGVFFKHDHRPGVRPNGVRTLAWLPWDGVGQEIK